MPKTQAPRRNKPEKTSFYDRGALVNGFAVFPCGCRFRWAVGGRERFICVAHQILIDAEVAA